MERMSTTGTIGPRQGKRVHRRCCGDFRPSEGVPGLVLQYQGCCVGMSRDVCTMFLYRQQASTNRRPSIKTSMLACSTLPTVLSCRARLVSVAPAPASHRYIRP